MAINQYNQGTITSASRVPVYDTVNGQPRTVSVAEFSFVVGQALTEPYAIPGYTLVLATVGIPLDATGVDGQLASDADAIALYLKSGGHWALYSGGGSGGAVTSVAGKTGAVTLAKADVGLSNVDNTADSAKPVSTAQQAALDEKADKPSAYATTTALQTALPAAANLGALALVGSAAPYARYMSNGASWLEVPELNRPAIQVATSRALDGQTDNGRVLEATATVTLTVPAGLPAGFRCVVIPSGTTSVAFSGGATGNGAATTITRTAAANSMFGIVQRASAANSYVIDGA